MTDVPPEDVERITDALLPYRQRRVRYAGFCVIDTSTHDDNEATVLATRRNEKAFDVDLLCVTELPTVAAAAYEMLFGKAS
jgi:hypothetical protein